MKIKSFVLFLGLVILNMSHICSAQTIADTSAVGGNHQSADTLNRSEIVADGISDFCGCKSVESVKQCSDCFKSSGPVLKAGHEMSFESKTVVKGSCWGFVNAVYTKAGVSKETVFSSKEGGPYASADKLKPGDWIYHVNYSFRNVGHSAIFVCWKDKAKKQAITMSYVGMNRAVPGRLDEADLKGVYSIFRAK